MRLLFIQILYRLQIRESWIIFFVLGIIMLTFPFLHIFNKPVLLLGLPLLFFYLIFGWIISILVIYLFVVANRDPQNTSSEKKHTS